MGGMVENNNTEGDCNESPIFLNSNQSNIYKNKTEEKVREINFIINEIRNHSPIAMWDLCSLVSVSHSKLYYVIRDLEFAGVVYTKVKLNKNNRSSRMVYISKGDKK